MCIVCCEKLDVQFAFLNNCASFTNDVLRIVQYPIKKSTDLSFMTGSVLFFFQLYRHS